MGKLLFGNGENARTGLLMGGVFSFFLKKTSACCAVVVRKYPEVTKRG
jgi:hypothetical protein